MYSKGNIEGIVKKVNQFAESVAGTDVALGPDATSQLGVIVESLAAADATMSVPLHTSPCDLSLSFVCIRAFHSPLVVLCYAPQL